METSNRFPAFMAYVPIIGWFYVIFTQRDNALARFHLRQSIGLFLFLVVVFCAWALAGWLLAWIPYMIVFGVALFALVIGALIFAAIILLAGMANALDGRARYLPIFGRYANHLPF